MPTEFEQFAIRFEQALMRYCPDNTYLTKAHIIQALREAVHPPGTSSTDYPRMLYLHGDREHYKIVPDAEAEAAAAAEGYGRTINPPDPRYPKWKTENSGVYGSRRVMLKDEADETQWRAAVDVSKWMDDPDHLWGGTGVPLAAIVEERKEQLKQLVDADALELVEDPANVELAERHHARLHEQLDEVLQSPVMSDADVESATEETHKES